MAKMLPLILFTVLTNAAAQILLKRGMLSIGSLSFEPNALGATALKIAMNPFVLGGLATFAISMVSHLVVLSKVELSFAYPFLSLAYVVVAAYAYFAFQEDLNLHRVSGIGLICLGTVLIARS